MHHHLHPAWQLLDEIEQRMQSAQLWQTDPPHAEAFNSCEPFCIDTMSAQAWLQWLFLPRMRELIISGVPLPSRFALTPYFEEAFKVNEVEHGHLLITLQKLDNLLNIEQTEC